ncbi:tape measure protein [Gordonia phage Harambe]|uniref:Tape measure protein n=1 Tax=Gordonia phage Harambe TaxID=2510575 RepID=A0A411B2T7_9CAUD|nr:tape measure protein [Gordonia phage Harambe]
MNTTAANILITAQARQAQAQLARMQAALRGLQSTAEGANAAQATAANAAAKQIEAAEAKKANAAARAALAIENSKLREIKAEQASQVAAAKSAAAISVAQTKAAQAAEVAAAKQEASAAKIAAAVEAGAIKQALAAEKMVLAQLRVAAATEAALARQIASDNAATLSAEKRAAAEIAARESTNIATMRAVASAESAAARKIASDAREALQAQVLANAETGSANKVVTARLRRAAQIAAANLQTINSNNGAAIAAEVAASREAKAARDAALAKIESALKAETSNARTSASNAAAAVSAQIAAIKEIESRAAADMARVNSAAIAAAENAKIVSSDAAVANAAAIAAAKVKVSEAEQAAAAQICAQRTAVAEAEKTAARTAAAAAAAVESSKIAASEARAAAAAETAALKIQAANERIAASNVTAAASTRSWSASMTAAGSRMQWIGKQLSQNFTAPMLLATGIGVKFGLDLEKGMTRLRKVYGDQEMEQYKLRTGIDLVKLETDALRGAVIALSNAYGIQADEVANVAAEWAAAGSSGAALAKQTELTMKTMVLGEMDAEEATKSLIAIQAQWGAVTETVTDKQNKLSLSSRQGAKDQLSLTTILRQLNAVENETGTTMNDLVVAFSRASGVARTAGLDTATLAAATAALVPAAGTAAEAGNALKTIISRTLTPTREASQIMNLMGINTKGAAWQSMNAAQRLAELSKRFGELTGAQKAQVSASLGSRYQVNKLEVLFASLANTTGYYHKALGLLANQSEVVRIAEQELNEVLTSQPQMLQQAGVIIQNSLMKAMVPMIPVVIQITQWIGKMFNAFASLPPGIRTTIVAAGLFLATVGPIIIFLGIFKLALGQLTPAIIFFGKMLLFPITGLVRLAAAMLLPLANVARLGGALLGLGRIFMAIPAIGMLMVRGVGFAMTGMQAATVVGMAGVRAAWATSWAAMITFQTVAGIAMTTRQAVIFTLMLAAQNVWAAASLAIQKGWGAAWVALTAIWKAADLAIRSTYAATVVAAQATWQALSLAGQRAWAAAWIALTAGWAAAGRMMAVAFGFGQLAIQKAWQAASLVLSAAFWKKAWGIFAAGNRGLLAIVAGGGKALLALFASPWAIAIAVVVGLLVLFRKQIKAAWNNILNYFRNIPKETAASLSPLTNLFVKAKNGIVRAFNALPEGVKNAMLKVVSIVAMAARKVYELFSYLNPFARHSPSLVENVTNGMAVVNQQFANAARNATGHINSIHKAIKSLDGASIGLKNQNSQADRAEFEDTATKAGVGAALPAYDALQREVEQSKKYMDQLNASIKAQEAHLKRIKTAVEQYDAVIEKMNSSLETTKAIQDSVNTALDGAKARYERFSNAQIEGTQAAEDAIFSNTMAQKRLQLQIAKMEEESGTIDSVTDSYSKLQGEIENLTAKQTELRKAGAGSDILGTYDKMIADLKSQQSGLITGGADSPAGKIAALQSSLEKLQKQAEIMDLEKALKFDSLNRNLEKFKSNVEEMPYGQIMSGLDQSRQSVNSLQFAYDTLDTVMAGQQARIDAMQAQRDALQKTYDAEEKKLEAVREQYSSVEEAVRSGEQALDDFSSAAEEAVRRQEEAARAAEEASKKLKEKKDGAGGGGGGGSDLSPGAQNFIDAAAGDFETFGGGATISREGGPGSQVAEIDQFTNDLTKGLEESLGSMNPFTPLKNAWNKTVSWFQGVAPGIGDVFSNVGSSIRGAFGGNQEEGIRKITEAFKNSNMSVEEYKKALDAIGADSSYNARMKYIQEDTSFFGSLWDSVWGKIGGPVKKVWGVVENFGKLIGGLFGDDLKTTLSELGNGFSGIFDKIKGPIQNFIDTIIPALSVAAQHLAPVFGAVILVLEVLWEVINGAIGPVFSWLGDIIGAVINIITGVIKVIMGAMKVIQGVVQVIIGLFKGLFTMDWGMFIDGLKNIFGGFGDMFGGIVDIVKGIFVAIWSTIKNAGKLIWNVVWGLVKGVIDFFVHLWDVLVGHSIIPDMVKAIIDWFLQLPGRVLSMVWNFILKLIGFFASLPGRILSAIATLGSILWNGISAAFTWLVDNGPGLLLGFLTFIGTIPLKVIETLAGFGMKLFEWAKAGFQFMVDKGPDILMGVLNWIGGIEWKLINGLLGFGQKLWDWMKGAWQWVVDKGGDIIAPVLNYFKELPGNFIRGLGNIGSKLWEWMKGGWDFLVNDFPNIIKGALDFIGGIPGKFLRRLGNGLTVMYNYGKDIIQGLMNGAGELLKKLGDWFLDKVPGWIKTPFKKALGIASPSKVFAGYGENIGEGLIVGIGNMQGQVEQASIAMAAAADKGEVGGISVSAVADTSSVGGTVSALEGAVAASGPVGVDTAASGPADIQPMLDAAIAAFESFDSTMQSKMAAFIAAVQVMFASMVSAVLAALSQVSIGGTTSFTQLQTSVLAIVTAMVAAVNAQLQQLISYVNQFGVQLTTAWASAWSAWRSETTAGVDHTLDEWQRMADGMRSVFDNGIAPIFEDIGTMYTTLEGATRTTVDNVGTTWAEVETKTKKPAGIVINEVYNKGLRGAWNKFNKFLGVDELPEFTVAYRTGGPVWGSGNGTSDSVNARLSRGEHVITAKEVEGAGGHKAVMQVRQMWRAGLPAYAMGGPVDPKAPPWPGEANLKPAAILARRNIHKYWPMVSEIGGYRPSDPYPDHPSGLALDIMVGNSNPVGDEINEWLHRNMVPLALNYTIWKQFYRPAGGVGNLMEDRGSITQNHFDHIHALFNDNGVPGIKTGGIGGSSGGAPIDYEKIVRESFKADMDEVRKSLPVIPGGIGQWPKVSADVAEKMALKHLLPIAKKMSISTGSTASAWAGAPDASVVEKVKAAVAMYGWDQGAEWEALNQLIGHESSWNPNAQNPSSTAYGLFQFLDSTWATVGGTKTSDPYLQAVYGARYIKNRYGSPSAAWAFWQNPQPNPYGGNWYDNGGYLQPGSQIVHNQTGGPEPVLTAVQWAAMFDLASRPPVTEDTLQDAVEKANIATGNTDDATTTAIIKGMDVWSKAWTPAMVDASDATTVAAEKVADAADKQTAGTVMLSKSLGKYDQQISALSKALVAFSNSAQQSVKVTVNVKTGESTTTGTSSVGTNERGEQVITVEAPTFEAWAPTINAVADLIEILPKAERDWAADNPVAGETEQQRKMRIAQNNLTNYAKGTYGVLQEVGPVALRHTAIIGTAVEKLVKEDAAAWSAALAAIAANNPAGYAVAVLLVLKEVATLLPLILAAILDIVPALIRAIVRFLTQFMPDSVFAYADMAAAEAAVQEQQEGGATAMGQGQRYPTDAMSTASGNESITLNMYGDLVMPNVSDGSDASDFIDQLRILAGGS